MKFTTSTGFPLVPAGIYEAKILSSELGDDGKIIVDFNLTDPKTLEELTKKEWISPVIDDFFPLFGYLVKLAGISGSEGEFDPKSFAGLEGIATVAHSTSKKTGKEYANIISIVKKN